MISPTWLPILLLALGQPPQADAAPPITAVAFSPERDQLLVGSQAGLRVLSWPDFEPAASVETQLANIHDLAFSSDGQLLLVAGGDPSISGVVETWNWPALTLVARHELHSDLVHGVAWSCDDLRGYSASTDRTLGVFDPRQATPATEKPQRLSGHARGVLDVAVLPGDQGVVTCSADGTLRVWDARTLQLQRTLDGHTSDAVALAVRATQDPQSRPVLASVGADRMLRLWQPTIGRQLRFLRLKSAPLDVTWLDDPARLAVTCQDGHLRIVDPDSLKIVRDEQVIDGWAYCVRAAPSGESLVVAGEGGKIVRVSLQEPAASEAH